MPDLTFDQRVEFCRVVWDTFKAVHKIKREISNSEWVLARGWATKGIPLRTVLQGIHETTGKVRRLEACERAVEENNRRRLKALGISERGYIPL